ncbi:MAG: AarF/ABC1/UbiB kinase family protein [Bacteroidia bacterium]|nr:AarF/ABC1/UbiB kinase family protein [Bacteroidia bacterium]
MGINSTIRNLGRLRQIMSVFVKYGFEDLIANSTLRNLVPEALRLKWMRQEQPALQYSRFERIRMAAEELGPTFVKLAQVLSNRPDIIPDGLVKEFEKLQDRVPPFEGETARSIVELEIGRPLEEVFKWFNDVPLASASIGQVHRACLIDGTEVVVKVQRPDVQAIVERDLQLLQEIVKRADRYLRKQGVLNAQDIVNVFERSMSKELDYSNEARNIQKFREFYKDRRDFYIPRVYRKYSTDKVLLIEFVSGCKFTDKKQLREWGLDIKKTVETGLNIYLAQIFEYGYFHADPHPGNVLVRQDGTICLIDFGMVGQLSKRDKVAFANVFVAMAKEDARKMALSMKKLAISDNVKDMRALETDLQGLIDDYATLDVSEASIAELTTQLQKVMLRYEMVVPASIFLIFRALAILEGIGKIMYPQLKTYDYIKPYGRKIVEEQLSPENIWSEIQYRGEQISSFLSGIPVDLKEIMQQARSGKIHFEVELQGYGYLLKKLDSITNRLVITFIICALIIGSSITATVPFPARYMTQYGLPYWSVLGYIIAGVLCVILLYAIVRRRFYK